MSHRPEGLAHDLPHLLGRRMILGGLASLAAGAAHASCIAVPPETAGPFPADGTNRIAGETANVLTEAGVVREDMRTSFAGLSPVAKGRPLELTLRLVDAGAGCAPRPGLALYLWHCDADGRYSLYEDADRNYLRAVGVADAAGVVRFTTVFPGAYGNRWPHIHFEVFENLTAAATGRASIYTAQIAFSAEDCGAVYDDATYARSARNFRGQTLARDIVFRDNDPAALDRQTVRIADIRAETLAGDVEIGI